MLQHKSWASHGFARVSLIDRLPSSLSLNILRTSHKAMALGNFPQERCLPRNKWWLGFELPPLQLLLRRAPTGTSTTSLDLPSSTPCKSADKGHNESTVGCWKYIRDPLNLSRSHPRSPIASSRDTHLQRTHQRPHLACFVRRNATAT